MRTPPKHVIAIVSALCLLSLLFLYNRSPKPHLHWQPHDSELAPVDANLDFNGHVIMGKLGNETIKLVEKVRLLCTVRKWLGVGGCIGIMN